MGSVLSGGLPFLKKRSIYSHLFHRLILNSTTRLFTDGFSSHLLRLVIRYKPSPDPALEPSFSTDWTQWAGAIVGACLVGFTGEHGRKWKSEKVVPAWFLGVLPLWVIPAKALGTAPSAPAEDNLKYLLAFAGALIHISFIWLRINLFSSVGGLLGDVFLHLLPETYQHVRMQHWKT